MLTVLLLLLSVVVEELDEDDVEEQEERGDEDRFEYAEVISGFLSGSNCID